MRFYIGLSTNGTLIDEAMADRIAATASTTSASAWTACARRTTTSAASTAPSSAAWRRCACCTTRGVKVGLRFTMTAMNAHDLPALLELMRDEEVDKFYFSHLNYAGRGNIHRARTRSSPPRARRWTCCSRRAWQAARHGRAEGLRHRQQRRRRRLPAAVGAAPPAALGAAAARAAGRLGRQFVSGVNVANIDNLGNVHPDTMWWHHDLGNVRERPFSAIWTDTSRPADGRPQAPAAAGRRALRRLRATSTICGGNTRVRAQQLTGDAWAEDPGCYLTTTRSAWPATAPPAWSQRPPAEQRLGPRHASRLLAVPAAALAVAAAMGRRHARPARRPRARTRRAVSRSTAPRCHGAQRLGGMGPALLPESLERLRPAEAAR